MNVKAVLYFTAGVVVGSAATFFAVKSKFKKDFDKKLAEETDIVRASYAKKMAEDNDKRKKEMLDKIEEQPKAEPAVKVNQQDIDRIIAGKQKTKDRETTRHKAAKVRKSYARNVFKDPPKRSEIEPDVDEEEDYDFYPSEGPTEPPYLIDEDQFVNENTYWSKTTLYVYSDGTVLDDKEEAVDNIDYLIGKDNRELLWDMADDSNCVLIRNEMLDTDFEILLFDEPYIPDTAPVRDD